MSVQFVLLPSPLLGPTTWRSVARELEGAGHEAIIVKAGYPIATAADVLRDLLRTIPDDNDIVLVPHSNAGMYAPAIAEVRPVSATVFVDAALPLVSGGSPLAPPWLFQRLTDLADADGVLPRWTDWWDDDVIDRLLPDPATRTAVEYEQMRLPLAYFASEVDAPRGWSHRPCAFLAFGNTYDQELSFAKEQGWPTRQLAGAHLHTLVDPVEVTTGILDLLDELDVFDPAT